jgi:protein involved in polysaccharide export with SLBB domain
MPSFAAKSPGCKPDGKPLNEGMVQPKLLLYGLAAVVLAACATSKPLRDETKPLSVGVAPYTVAVLDEVRIRYRDGRTESGTVGQDGMLVIGETSVRAAGLPREAVERGVRATAPGIASAEVVEFRPNRVTVLGEVFHQIHTDLGDGPMRLMDAIASANGFTPLANKRRVRLLRENAGRSEVYEIDLRQMMLGAGLGANFLLQPGDVITVPRNFL